MHVPPPVYTAFAVVVLWVLSGWAPGPTIDRPWLTVAGLISVAIGAGIAATAVRHFSAEATTIRPNQLEQMSTLVTEGFYRFSRNPMYLGMVLVIVGVGAMLGSLWTIPVTAGFVWIITERQIKPEERALEVMFGDDYVTYKSRVRRWI